MTIKFFWNGLKDSGGKLQKAHYSIGAYSAQSGLAESTITIYARDYKRFSQEVRDVFTVENDSDWLSDYHADDTIRVAIDHPLYTQVKAALEAKKQHYAKLDHRVAHYA